MPDVQILAPGTNPSPLDYVVPGAQEILVKTVAASFDGTSAGGSYVPTLQLIAPGGVVAASCPLGTSVAAGASADVTWFPGVAPQGNGVFPFLNRLYDNLLTASAASFDITGISQAFGTLAFVTYLRSDGNYVNSEAPVTFNGKSGAGVFYEYWDSAGGKTQNATGQPPFGLNGANADANHYAISWSVLPNYAVSNTDHGMAGYTARLGNTANQATWDLFSLAVQYCSATNPIAINRVTIVPPTPGDKFVAGSRVTVYGL